MCRKINILYVVKIFWQEKIFPEKILVGQSGAI
jgi:hypothetical protein